MMGKDILVILVIRSGFKTSDQVPRSKAGNGVLKPFLLRYTQILTLHLSELTTADKLLPSLNLQ
jgi:hypothetical protein